nr:MAG: helix-turn-helix domain protein [Bacteriophage sp.]
MAKKPFTAIIRGREIPVCQNAYTGLFYAIRPNGKHTPINYNLISTQTTSMQRLKYWRNRYGYTQAELARLIHVSSPTNIMMWENGLRHPRKKYRQLLNAELNYDIFPD